MLCGCGRVLISDLLQSSSGSVANGVAVLLTGTDTILFGFFLAPIAKDTGPRGAAVVVVEVVVVRTPTVGGGGGGSGPGRAGGAGGAGGVVVVDADGGFGGSSVGRCGCGGAYI